MSATDVRRVVEHSKASAPCLITILKQFGWRVFIIRRRLSRLKTRIQRAEKKSQPTPTLEFQKEEELSVDLERYEDLLNDFAKAINERTGIPTSKLVEVATSTTDGEDWDYIYAELKDLDQHRVNAELWEALLSRDPDALVSVGLLPSSESCPPAPEPGRLGSKADDESSPTTMPNAETLALRNEVESVADNAVVRNTMRGLTNVPTVEPRTLKRLELAADSIIEAIDDEPAAAKTPIVGSPPLPLPKEKWPREEYARDAIIRLKEKPELQSNISAFCRTIAAKEKVPAIAASLKKLLYQPEYRKLWHPTK